MCPCQLYHELFYFGSLSRPETLEKLKQVKCVSLEHLSRNPSLVTLLPRFKSESISVGPRTSGNDSHSGFKSTEHLFGNVRAEPFFRNEKIYIK